MEKTTLEETISIFRQLSPVNQRYFQMMVRVADIAEKNVRKANQEQTDCSGTRQEN